MTGPITPSDIDAVIAATLKGRSDGAKANLAALQLIRGTPGFETVPLAAERSNCEESTIYTARVRVENAIACNRKSELLARQYKALATPQNLSCN